jgi:hypothetical protein
MWRWQEVAGWFAEILGEQQQVGDPAKAQFITAFNAGLKWREAGETLPPRERLRIRHLVG